MRTYTFNMVAEPGEDCWHAYCPALPEKGAATWRHTRAEAARIRSLAIAMDAA
jgi:hypothetical protein